MFNSSASLSVSVSEGSLALSEKDNANSGGR
jgi:hypothetical protein